MALNLLRIARNDYIDREYGGRLVAPGEGAAPRRLSADSDAGGTLMPPVRTDHRARAARQGVLRRMDIRAVAFDVNGTLVRILTEDGTEQVFRAAAHFLTYQGIDLRRHEVRELYFRLLKEQQRTSAEEHPEFDAVGIWRDILDDAPHVTSPALCPPPSSSRCRCSWPRCAAAISRRRLSLYPHVGRC